MDKKNHPLTNELLAKKFKSNFELVNYAIKLAENMIKSGRDARVKSDSQNRALLILQEITEGKDQFDLIAEVVEREKRMDDQSIINGEERKVRSEERAERMERRLERMEQRDRSEKSERRKSKAVLFDE